MLKLLLILLTVAFELNGIASAQVIHESASHFATTGTISSFSWAPENYQDSAHPNSFTYDIFYYIPDSLKNQRNVKAMIFNHGGGDSTLTREGSIKVVNRYLPNLKQLADDLQIIVILPSANGLNWGAHMIGLMRSLGALVRTELSVDGNNLALAGHSMGGMGITRNYLWLADEFSFFLPMAAGMDLAPFTTPQSLEQNLNKEFNVPYIHLQGLNDSFQVFVDRCKSQLEETQKLEAQYGLKSKLQMIFYNTDHQYIYSFFRDHAAEAFKIPRDLYQKELWGSLLTRDAFATTNNITFRLSNDARYFWVEAFQPDLTESERIDFHAKIDRNDIKIDLQAEKGGLPAMTKKLKIYLASRMLNLHQRVRIFINGKLSGTYSWNLFHKLRHRHLRSMDPSDPAFEYQDSVIVDIPQKP